jgi:hypothetical protein
MQVIRLYKGVNAIAKLGDEGDKMVEEHLAFRFPPESFLHTYLAQKFFYNEKNGIQFRSSFEKDVPNMSFHDAERLLLYWEKIVKKFSGSHTSVKNYLARMKELLYVTAMVRLMGATEVKGDAVKLFFASPLSRSKFVDERENERLWNNVGKIANDLDNKNIPNISNDLSNAWDALVEAGEELPGRLKKVANAARDAGSVLVDTISKPSVSLAKSLGDILGNFFGGIAKGVGTPIGAVIAVGAGYIVWKKWPRKSSNVKQIKGKK